MDLISNEINSIKKIFIYISEAGLLGNTWRLSYTHSSNPDVCLEAITDPTMKMDCLRGKICQVSFKLTFNLAQLLRILFINSFIFLHVFIFLPKLVTINKIPLVLIIIPSSCYLQGCSWTSADFWKPTANSCPAGQTVWEEHLTLTLRRNTSDQLNLFLWIYQT